MKNQNYYRASRKTQILVASFAKYLHALSLYLSVTTFLEMPYNAIISLFVVVLITKKQN